MLFLGALGIGLVLTTGVTGPGVFTNQGAIWTVLLDTAAAVGNGMMSLLVFRVLTPKGVPTSDLVWGGVAWTVMQAFGNFLVGRYLHNDRSVCVAQETTGGSQSRSDLVPLTEPLGCRAQGPAI